MCAGFGLGGQQNPESGYLCGQGPSRGRAWSTKKETICPGAHSPLSGGAQISLRQVSQARALRT